MKFQSFICVPNLTGQWVATGYIKNIKLLVFIFNKVRKPTNDENEDIAVLLAIPNSSEAQQPIDEVCQAHLSSIEYYKKQSRHHQLHVFLPQFSIIIKDTTLTRVINLLTEHLNAVIFQ